MTELLPSERLDDLLTNGLHIIQSDEVFCFSLDAVLLAHFCKVPTQHGAIVDLCSGNGIIPLLLSTRTKASIVGVEIQPRLADMGVRSVEHNGLQAQVRMIHGDLRDFLRMRHAAERCHGISPGTVDLVTVNPPYLPLQSGDLSPNRYIASARHEMDCRLGEVVEAAAILLKRGGRLAMVHRPARMNELFSELINSRLEPKRIRFVHPRLHHEANMVLIEAVKYGKPELRIAPPLVVHDEYGYHPEVAEMLYGKGGR